MLQPSNPEAPRELARSPGKPLAHDSAARGSALARDPLAPGCYPAGEAVQAGTPRTPQTPAVAAALSAARRPLTPRRRRRKRRGGPAGPGRGASGMEEAEAAEAAARGAELCGPEWGPGPLSRECLLVRVPEGWRGLGGFSEPSGVPEPWEERS